MLIMHGIFQQYLAEAAAMIVETGDDRVEQRTKP